MASYLPSLDDLHVADIRLYDVMLRLDVIEKLCREVLRISIPAERPPVQAAESLFQVPVIGTDAQVTSVGHPAYEQFKNDFSKFVASERIAHPVAPVVLPTAKTAKAVATKVELAAPCPPSEKRKFRQVKCLSCGKVISVTTRVAKNGSDNTQKCCGNKCGRTYRARVKRQKKKNEKKFSLRTFTPEDTSDQVVHKDVVGRAVMVAAMAKRPKSTGMYDVPLNTEPLPKNIPGTNIPKEEEERGMTPPSPTPRADSAASSTGSSVWTQTAPKPFPQGFVPLQERAQEEIRVINGPAGTGKSTLAVEIIKNNRDRRVFVMTSSWAALWEFAVKLRGEGIHPHIPMMARPETELCARARKDLWDDYYIRQGNYQVTLLIMSMVTASPWVSERTREEKMDRKTKSFKNVHRCTESGDRWGKLNVMGMSLKCPDIMIIDEAGTVPEYTLQTVTFGIGKVVMMGDQFQRKPIEDKDTLKVMRAYQFTAEGKNWFTESKRAEKLDVGRRCPRDIYAYVSPTYNYTIRGTSASASSVRSLQGGVHCCPTIDSLREGWKTIDELQGHTVEDLILHTPRAQDTAFLRKRPESALVALTRHTRGFTWKNGRDEKDAHDFARTFLGFKGPPVTTWEEERVDRLVAGFTSEEKVLQELKKSKEDALKIFCQMENGAEKRSLGESIAQIERMVGKMTGTPKLF